MIYKFQFKLLNYLGSAEKSNHENFKSHKFYHVRKLIDNEGLKANGKKRQMNNPLLI